MTPPLLALYNQTFQDDESFLAGFVARSELAEFLLRQLRAQADDAPAQAQLLVGQRGMGKTSLLRRVAIAVASEENLRRRYLPLRFREEQYNVLTLAHFWRNTAEALAEWCEANAPNSPFPDLFDRKSETPEWRDGETVLAAILSEARRLGARPLLLVDNLDLILDAISAQENWALRRALQAPRGPALIAAATHIPDSTGDRDAAFYEFFRLHLLRPLTADDLLVCLRRIAEARGEAGQAVTGVIEREPQRLRALHAFTGGNPRVLALIYRLIESEATHEALGDLEALLDQLTPYFKSRIEEYATPQQRAVIDALALNWDPVLAHDLAAATGIVITTVSSHLSRLRNDGLIEEVELAGARAGYQMVERLFNIWYLMRHGTRRARQRVSWLTKFLVLFYPADELRRRFSAEAAAPSRLLREYADYREALAGAVEQITGKNGAAASADATTDEAMAIRDELARMVQAGRHSEALALIEAALAKAEAAAAAGSPLAAARLLVSKGAVLILFGREPEGILASDEVVARFGAAGDPALREAAAKALFNKGVALYRLGRNEETVAAYDEAISRFGAASETGLRAYVAGALVNKGAALRSLGRSEEEVAAYDEAIARIGAASEPALREDFARALVNKGVALERLGRSEPSLAAFDEAVSRFGEASEPALQEEVARALVDKGIALERLGRNEDSVAAFDEAIDRFGAAGEPALRDLVAMALFWAADVRANALGRLDEAERDYLRLVASGQTFEDDARSQAAWLALLRGARDDAGALRRDLKEATPTRSALLDAGLELAADNFGAATALFDRAAEVAGGILSPDDDLIGLLRLVHARGYSEKWIAHFEAAGHADRMAPVHAAFVALERGERHLRNVNPETRAPAETIYGKLAAAFRKPAPTPKEATGAKRGRPAKRRGG
jgi:tetratricopeptide (TPR) repeat protein